MRVTLQANVLTARWAPARTVLAAALASVALLACMVWVAMHTPWLGAEFGPRDGAGGLQVMSVDPKGPSAGRLHAGDVVVSLGSPVYGRTMPLDALLVTRSGHRFASFSSVRRFLTDEQAMFEAAQKGPLLLRLAGGETLSIEARRTRPLSALPLDFWLAGALAATALLAAGAVLAFRHTEAVVRLFFIGTLGFAGTQATAAVIFGRELLFDARWAEFAIGINLASRLLSYWALVMMLWVYPRRFGPVMAGIPVGAVYALAWLGEVLEWWPRPNLATPLMATLTSLVAAPLLGAWQWRATRFHALDHMAARVMVLSFAVPTLLLTLTYQLPRLFGQPPLIESVPALSAINLLMFVGFAVGIARFRLFQLGRWWFETVVWVVGGALVIVLDLLLLRLNASAGLALGAALAIAGWAYFPLRQWIWRRFDRQPGPLIERHLPRLVDQLMQSGSLAELAQRWLGLMDEVFRPLVATPLPGSCAAPRLDGSGTILVVPGLSADESIVLEHAAKGERLFTGADVELAGELLALCRRAADARQALDQRQAERDAQLRERELMMQDLHDGLGGLASNIALLAGMARRTATTPELGRTLTTIETLAAESLSEIRGFMNSLDPSDADWQVVAADLRAEGGRRVEAHGLGFEMRVAIDPASPPPEPLLRLNLPRVFQEAINNVVKHARASRVQVDLEVDPHKLVLSIADDGRGLGDPGAAGAAPAAGTRARGVGIMQRRAQQLGGTLEFERHPGTTVLLSVPLPLPSPAPGMPPGRACD